MTALALGRCGSLAYCSGTFLHLFRMYKDHLEKLVKNAMDLTENKDRDFDLSPINIQFTIAVLWVALAVRTNATKLDRAFSKAQSLGVRNIEQVSPYSLAPRESTNS